MISHAIHQPAQLQRSARAGHHSRTKSRCSHFALSGISLLLNTKRVKHFETRILLKDSLHCPFTFPEVAKHRLNPKGDQSMCQIFFFSAPKEIRLRVSTFTFDDQSHETLQKTICSSHFLATPTMHMVVNKSETVGNGGWETSGMRSGEEAKN